MRWAQRYNREQGLVPGEVALIEERQLTFHTAFRYYSSALKSLRASPLPAGKHANPLASPWRLCSGAPFVQPHVFQAPSSLWLLEHSPGMLHTLLRCSVYILNFSTSFKPLVQCHFLPSLWNILSSPAPSLCRQQSAQGCHWLCICV